MEHFMQNGYNKGKKWQGPNRSKRLRRGGENTQKNCTKKGLVTQITRCDHSPRARHPGVQSQVGLRKHHHEQS